MSILLFFLGLLLPLAIAGGFELVYYVIDNVKYHHIIRELKLIGKKEELAKRTRPVQDKEIKTETIEEIKTEEIEIKEETK